MLYSLLEFKSLNLKCLAVLYSGCSAVLTGISVRFNFGISLARIEQVLNRERYWSKKRGMGSSRYKYPNTIKDIQKSKSLLLRSPSYDCF